jgi:hypothetical protein
VGLPQLFWIPAFFLSYFGLLVLRVGPAWLILAPLCAVGLLTLDRTFLVSGQPGPDPSGDELKRRREFGSWRWRVPNTPSRRRRQASQLSIIHAILRPIPPIRFWYRTRSEPAKRGRSAANASTKVERHRAIYECGGET